MDTIVNETQAQTMTTQAQTPPENTPVWRHYWKLCKPRVLREIVFATVVGIFLAVPAPGLPPLGLAFWAILGISLAAASAAAVNQIVEYRIDAEMGRTENRPLPKGDLTIHQATVFAVLVGALSVGILLAFTNVLATVLTFFTLIGYAIVYTVYLKPATPQNIVIGGVTGAVPPVLGWCAITGDVHPHALLLSLIIFVWTPPHFWALAIARLDDYRTVAKKIPVLPVTRRHPHHPVAYFPLRYPAVHRRPVSLSHPYERPDLPSRGGGFRRHVPAPLLAAEAGSQPRCRLENLPQLTGLSCGDFFGSAGRPLCETLIRHRMATKNNPNRWGQGNTTAAGATQPSLRCSATTVV